MKHFGLSTKLTIMVVSTLVIIIFASALMIREFFYHQVIAQKMTTASILTDSIVHDIKYDQDAGRNSLETIIRKYITYYRFISTLSYFNSDLVNTADANRANVGRRTYNPAIRSAVETAKPSLEILTVDDERLVIRSIAPILRGSKISGAVVIDLSIEDLELILRAIDLRVGSILLLTASGGTVVIDERQKPIRGIGDGNREFRPNNGN
jgi:hypothetical protein